MNLAKYFTLAAVYESMKSLLSFLLSKGNDDLQAVSVSFLSWPFLDNPAQLQIVDVKYPQQVQ